MWKLYGDRPILSVGDARSFVHGVVQSHFLARSIRVPPPHSFLSLSCVHRRPCCFDWECLAAVSSQHLTSQDAAHFTTVDHAR